MVLSEGDALKNVNSPLEYQYIKALSCILRAIGAWPDGLLKRGKSNHHNAFIFTLMLGKILTAYGVSTYLRANSSILPFMEIGHGYITLFMTFNTLCRLSTLSLNVKYHELVKKFLTEVHLFYYKGESEYALKTHVTVHKFSKILCYYLITLCILVSCFFNCIPMFVNYRNGKFDRENPNNISFKYSIYYNLPFDSATNFNAYVVLTIVNWYSSVICSLVFCMMDCILFIIVFHVRGHFKILLHNLGDFPMPDLSNDGQSALKYSEVEMAEVEKKLKECIDYHRKLLDFTSEISSVFGPMLFVYYTFHQISDCLLLLELSEMSATAFLIYGPLALGLHQQLIQLSFIIESIGTVTGQLKDAVYFLPWEYMDTKNRKTVMIFMMNVAEPVHVNALGLAKVGVTSMASILKTSFSYFAFLRSAADE